MPDSYNVNDLVKVGQVKKLGTNVATRLSALEAVGAERNVIVGIQQNGVDLEVDSTTRKVNVVIPAADTYAITKDDNSGDYAAIYRLKKNGTTDCGVAINIPKDMVVSSGTVETKSESGAWGPAGTYIHLVLANADNSDLYINVGSLIEYVTGDTAADGIITVSVDSTTHVATATIGDGTVPLTKLTAAAQSTISGKADKVTPAATGNVATLDAAGNLADGGKTVAQLTNVIEGVQVNGNDLTPDANKKVNINISGKADKLTGSTENNIALVGANGAYKDGGAAICGDAAFDAMLTEIGLLTTT